jgi:diguanylate cyclase (GGDEF)-like protein
MPILSTITSGLGTLAAAKSASVTQRLAVLMDLFKSRAGTPPPPPSTADTHASQELSRLEAEVLRLHRERSLISSENQLLNEIIGQTGQTAGSRLLRRLIPQPAEGLAALLDLSTSNPVLVATRGKSLDLESRFQIPERLLDQLRSEPLLIRGFELGNTGHRGDSCVAIQESPVDQRHSSPVDAAETTLEMFLIPIRIDDQLKGLLATTSLWPAGLRRQEQVEILARLCRTILVNFAQDRQREQHQSELWLAREMLRLKSVTDRAIDQPLDTLGDFVMALCDTIEMDRGALFLVSRRTEDVPAPVVEAGMELPLTVSSQWRSHEIHLVEAISGRTAGEFLDPERLQETGIDSMWGQAVAWPLQFAGRSLGTLILSRRNRESLSVAGQQLVQWGADLLAQTLHRIYRDASIRRQARHDGLTDLANRRTFDALLAGEVDRVRLGLSEDCSLLLADLDRFKLVNDAFGHQAGDEVLRATAQKLREHVGRMRVGERSLLARYGGEELAVLLPGVGLAGALRVAEEIRAAIQQLTIPYGDNQLGVTVSIGVASCPMHGLGASDLVAAADGALYRAKTEGRNRVCRPADGC